MNALSETKTGDPLYGEPKRRWVRPVTAVPLHALSAGDLVGFGLESGGSSTATFEHGRAKRKD